MAFNASICFKYLPPLNAANILCCSPNQFFPWFPVYFLKFLLIASANSFCCFLYFIAKEAPFLGIELNLTLRNLIVDRRKKHS